MKRNKIFALIFAVTILLSMVSTGYEVSAHELDVVDISSKEIIIKPDYQDVCHGLPYHRMYANGWCDVYKNGQKYIDWGCLWKCEYCNQVLVTEGDIYYGGAEPIGKYATCTLSDGQSVNYLNRIDQASYYGYTKATDLATYKRLFRKY